MSTNGNGIDQISRDEALLYASILNAKAQRAGASPDKNTPAATTSLNTQGGIQPNHSTRFRKAVKFGAKGRVALIGVSGSGKSFTMLTLARALAGPGGKIAAVDTEHGSLSKYADLFSFDVDEPASYTDEYLLAQLDYAEQNGYAVFCVDSLSHFWMGADGTLEFVDKMRKRQQDGNQFAGWNAWNPKERKIIDRFLGSPCHIIVTMRVKTEYQEVLDSKGRKKRMKVGLQPVQRDGLEYEFDLVCSMDDENNLLIDKTRCMAYSDPKLHVAAKPDAKYFEPFIGWLAGAERPAPAVAPHQQPVQPTPRPVLVQSVQKPWMNKAGMLEEFAKLAAMVPPEIYFRHMQAAGVNDPADFKTQNPAWQCYQKILADAEEYARQATDPSTFENFESTEGEWQ